MLNLKVTPYTGELAQIAKVMLQDQPEWVIDSSEIEFHAELGKGTAAKVYKGPLRSLKMSYRGIGRAYFPI